ncbi:MAG: HAD family phosphatase [Deltaproteobacteria bacterium]|nr:HAD family phosphatase [Deltaproteobacteria bacterium]
MSEPKSLFSMPPARLAQVRVILTDIDGTMTRAGRIPPEVVAMAPKLLKLGVEVLPVTGRSAGEALGLARYLPGVRRAIAENGGALVIPDQPIEELRPAVDRAAMHRAAAELSSKDPWMLAPCSFARLTDQAWERGGRSDEQLAQLRDNAGEMGLSLTWSSVHIHLTVAHPDKGAAALTVLEREGIDPQHAAAIGDSTNDEGLWVAERFGLAVGTADVQRVWPLLRHRPEFMVAPAADGWLQLCEAVAMVRRL